MTTDIVLNVKNGTKIVVPNTLNAMTTYVLLEQERWFEKEWGFIERLLLPGMTALDIGANLGLYSTAMARAVGASGRIIAYEPTSDTRRRLLATLTVNDMQQVTVVASALSDSEREGRIVFGGSSELNHLGSSEDGNGEAVHLTSLDLERARNGWNHIDFIKLDAEGEELRIIAGGKSVFEHDDPIVMFEIKAADIYEPRIAVQFSNMGYELFRLLPNCDLLVPFDSTQIDSFELNLFAVKPRVATELSARGLLARSRSSAIQGDWASWLSTRPYGQMFTDVGEARTTLYKEGLDAYAAWRNPELQPDERFSALLAARDAFAGSVEEHRDLARLISLARAELDLGFRGQSNNTVREVANQINAGTKIWEPFPPLVLRYESIFGRLDGWVFMSLIEIMEFESKYSTFFGKVDPNIDRMIGTKYLSAEIERRRALSALRRGQHVQLSMDLRKAAADHLNADAWAHLIN